jgi:hypothetical protein
MHDLVVPPGLFKSTRVGKHRGRGDEQMQRVNETSTRSSTTVVRTYAPFPSLHNHYPPQSKASESVMMYEPYENANLSGYSYAHDPSPCYSAVVSAPDHDRPPTQSYPDTIHDATTPSPPLGYQPISHPIQSNVHPVAGSLTYTQGGSTPTTSISTHQTAHRPSLSHQSSAAYSVPPQSRRSPSPAALNVTHADDTIDRPSGFYFPSESPPTYTDRPLHGPSATHSYPPDISSQDHSTRHGISTDSGPPYRHDFHISASQSSPPHLPPIRIDPFPPSYELLATTETNHPEGRRGSIGPDRDLAPMHALTRPHPYRRDPQDDKTLRLLTPRSS